VRESIDAWNAHDPDGVARLVTNEFVSESDMVPAPLQGPDAVKQVVQMYVHAFPDLHFEIEQMVASGDYVITRWRATGTHGGELMGIPATNRPAVTHGCSVTEVREGKMTREWVYWDTGNLLRATRCPSQPTAAGAR
jgi:steroid delta-isomerase-like uncharacterized protein